MSVLTPDVSFRIQDVSRQIWDVSQPSRQLALALALPDEGLKPGMLQAVR